MTTDPTTTPQQDFVTAVQGNLAAVEGRAHTAQRSHKGDKDVRLVCQAVLDAAAALGELLDSWDAPPAPPASAA